MRALIALFLVLGASGASVAADGAGRFRTVAVYVDAGQAPLAAYQVVITVGDTAPTAKIVGVEGGSATPFARRHTMTRRRSRAGGSSSQLSRPRRPRRAAERK